VFTANQTSNDAELITIATTAALLKAKMAGEGTYELLAELHLSFMLAYKARPVPILVLRFFNDL